MRHDRAHYRPGTAAQFDLFGPPESRSMGQNPAWEALPAHVRAELTALMVRLILEHARSAGATAIGAVRHEP